jgi:hypothetical protein
MVHDATSVVTAGIVTLAFFILVGFAIWRLTATVPGRTVRALVVLTSVLACLPAVLYAVLGMKR